MTNQLDQLRETIKLFKRHGCTDSQIVAILLDPGESELPPAPGPVPADPAPAAGDGQVHD